MSTVADVMTAIQTNDIDTLKSLLATQPELAGERDGNGNSPLLMSTYYGRSEMIHLILGLGVRPNIFESSAAGLTRNLEILLKDNPSLVSQKSHDGWTALHLAAFFGHQDLVRILLDAGASMLTISNNNEANLPINAAAAGRRNAVVRVLVERGCPPDARASDAGYTALH